MSLRSNVANGLVNIAKSLMGGDVGGADSAFAINQLFGANQDTKKLGKYKGIVFAAVNLISDKVKSYQPIFNTRQPDGHLEPIPNHPLLELFAHPSDGVSQSDFFKAVSVYKSMLGESFWYIPLGELTGKPNIAKGSGIYLLPPERMGLKIDDTGTVIGYCLRKSDGSEVLFKPEEIKLHKTFNPMNPYRGYGIVEAAIDYVETEEGARNFTRNFFKNNGAPAGIISVKGDISKENFKIFAERWREQHEGTKNAGKIAIIRGSEIDFTKTALGLDQIDMQALKDLTVTEVLRMFRVPKALLGEETALGMSRANIESFEYIFAKETIEPELDALDDSIQDLLKRFYPQDQLFVTHELTIPEDKEFELRERQAGVDIWLTRNEIRQEEGLNDQPGGEFLRAAVMSSPIGPASTEPENTDYDSEEETKSGGKVYLTVTKVKKKNEVETTNKEAFRLNLQKNQLIYQKKFSEALAPVLKRQKKEVLKNWDKINGKSGTWLTKATNSQLLDLDKAIKDFQNDLFPVELALADDQGQLALAFAGDAEANFELTPAVQKKIRDALEKVGYNFNEETLQAVTDVIAQDLADGLGTAAIADDISSVYNDVQGYRADRLARTETLRASNQATKLAYEQTGYVTALEWYANPTACEFCAELSGEVVGFDNNFANLGDSIDLSNGASLDINYSNIETPPLHPNCECTIIPNYEEQQQSK